MDEIISEVEAKIRKYGIGTHTYQLQKHLDNLYEKRAKMEMYKVPSYSVTFSDFTQDNSIVFADGNIVVPEKLAYSFIFSMGVENGLKSCGNHAINKIMKSVENKIKLATV